MRRGVRGATSTATQSALTIAVRYGGIRRQFGTPDADRKVYALHFAQTDLVTALSQVQGGDGPVDEHRQRELKPRAAGLKAAQTWHASRTIQMCREACGGAGYLAENRLPSLKADTDVFTTFEGDNTVLLQGCRHRPRFRPGEARLDRVHQLAEQLRPSLSVYSVGGSHRRIS